MRDRDTSARLAAAARAAGIAIPAGERNAVVAGATWLKSRIELLRRAGLGK